MHVVETGTHEDRMNSQVRRVEMEHRHLDAEAAALQDLLKGGPEQLPTIFQVLSGFASALAEHLMHEHAVLDAALRKRNPTGRSRAELDAELQALRWDWEECLSNWDERSAPAEWNLFADHLSGLLTRIRRRVALESDLLRP
jgi:hypothetical protein